MRQGTKYCRRTFNSIHTESRLSRNSRQLTWKSVLWCNSGSRPRLNSNLTFSRMFASATKHNFHSPVMSIAKTWCFGDYNHHCTIARYAVHCLGGHLKIWHYRTILAWKWRRGDSHLEHVVAWIETCNGSNKMVQFHIQLTSQWSGSIIDFLICWLEDAANRSGLRIHPIWTPWIFNSGSSWRTMCMATIFNLLPNWKWP